MIVELVQTKRVDFASGMPSVGSFPFRAGVTLIISAPYVDFWGNEGLPQVRYAVKKGFCGPGGKRREDRQREFLLAQGMANGNTEDPNHFQANFGLLHQGL